VSWADQVASASLWSHVCCWSGQWRPDNDISPCLTRQP